MIKVLCPEAVEVNIRGGMLQKGSAHTQLATNFHILGGFHLESGSIVFSAVSAAADMVVVA